MSHRSVVVLFDAACHTPGLTDDTSSPQPPDKTSLSEALAAGKLTPLYKPRIRASLAMFDGANPKTVRQGLMFILERVSLYLCCIDYAGPDRIVGRTDWESPHAKRRRYVRRGEAGAWYLPAMRADHHASYAELFEDAGAMCFDTASRLAVHETAQVVPESAIHHLATTWRGLLFQPEASGVKWEKSRRRLGTKGARKVVERVLAILPACKVGLDGPMHVIIAMPGESFAYMGSRVDWDLPEVGE